MPDYKLTYFNSRGLAEVSRQLFHLANVPFQDHRLTSEEFQTLKPNLPTGQVPILHIDGVPFSQSTAIARYLARKFGFAGECPEEELLADSVVDTFKDFIVSFRELIIAILSGKTEEQVREVKDNVARPAARIYFNYLNKVLEKSASGFLVGKSLTWADLVVTDNLTTCLNTDLLDENEEKQLAEYRKRILEIPKLKEYLEKRPETRF